MKKLTLVFFIICYAQLTNAQFQNYTVIFQPDQILGNDAPVILKTNDPSAATTSFPLNKELGAYNISNEGKMRSYLKFNEILHVPYGTQIVSAKLVLSPILQSPNYPNPIFGDNRCILSKASTAWEDTLINWNNQPGESPELQTEFEYTNQPGDTIEVECTNMIQDMVNNNPTIYGFIIKLVNESIDASLIFGAADHDDATKRPYLRIIMTNQTACAQVVKAVYTSFYKGAKIDGFDAPVWDQYSGGNARDINFNALPEICASYWSYNSVNGINTSYFDFKALRSLSPSINSPTGPIIRILSARLFLTGINTNSSIPFPQGNAYPGGATDVHGNTCYVQRIIQPWNEQTITFNNRPQITSQNFVEIQASTSQWNYNCFSLDVTGIVKDIVSNPTQGYGFYIELIDNHVLRSITFAGFEHPNRSIHPRLEVLFTYLPVQEYTLTIQPGLSDGSDARIMSPNPENTYNYGGLNVFDMGAWLTSGKQYIGRSLLNFNFPTLPSNAFLTEANLTIYNNGYNVGNGDNSSIINRVTGPQWNENTVTWNSNIGFTSHNRVRIPRITSTTGTFITKNLLPLYHDMYRNQSYLGLLLRPIDERNSTGINGSNPNRIMQFSSSETSIASRRPALTLKYIVACDPVVMSSRSNHLNSNFEEIATKANSSWYKPSDSTLTQKNSDISGNVYPNPATTIARIEFAKDEPGDVTIEIVDLAGIRKKYYQLKELKQGKVVKTVDMADLKSGLYFIKITFSSGRTGVIKYLKP
jgi:hypothetical protein